MRLSIDSLTVLDAIDRHGSFAAAAEALHRVPSAITYAVQKLEEDMDVLIFDRSGHRAQLTEAGRELLKEGRRLLQAAAEIEARTRRVATGYEVELRIAVDDLIPMEKLFPVLEAFYKTSCGTRLRILTEVYGGTWDALMTDRADLVIGAPSEGPFGGGYQTEALGVVQWGFMVAPHHPLASAPEPIPSELVAQHRSIAAADSSRNHHLRTTGLLSGQDVLTVPEMHSKIRFQCAGLGVGYLPRHLTRDLVQTGKLVVKQVEEPRHDTTLYLAWRQQHRGKALSWLIERLREPALRDSLLA